jgi:hypothetical protein
MSSIRPVFTRSAAPPSGFDTFWLLVFAIAIIDDAQRRDERRGKDRERKRAPQRKPPAGPRPC